jgi:hypothetical protein
VLFDPEEKEIGPDKVEVITASDVSVYETGDEMFEAYRRLKREGRSVTFCTPHYRDHFVVEQVPSRRVIVS